MNTATCNFQAYSLWYAIVFTSVGWIVLVYGIVFLSMAIHFERGRRKRAQNEIIVAKTSRPRQTIIPTATPLTEKYDRPMSPFPMAVNPSSAAPIRPTDLPIRDPYLPLQQPTPTPKNIAPNAFTYLPKSLLGQDPNFSAQMQPSYVSDRWGVQQSNNYVNEAYED